MATPESWRYYAETDLLYAASKHALEDLGLTIEDADLDRNFIHFRSSSKWRTLAGQELSISFLEEMGNAVDIRVSTRLNAHGDMLDVPDWRDGRKLAKLVLARIAEYIDTDDPTVLLKPASDASSCRACKAAISATQTKLIYCEVCALNPMNTDSVAAPPKVKPLDESEDDFFAAMGMGDLASKGKSRPKPKPKKPEVQTQLVLECECGARLRIKTKAKGTKLKCPKCGLAIVID
jgi:hypothetical protein